MTPLASFPGYFGYRVINVYAAFDEPVDQCVGVVGTPNHPFLVATEGGSGWVNSSLPNCCTPSFQLVQALPALNYDTFYGVGLFTDGPGSPDGPGDLQDQVIVSAGSPPPVNDPWGGPGGNGTNFAYTVPPTTDGVPTPQSVAGNFPGRRIFLMRLVVQPGEDVSGEFGVLVFTGGQGFELGASFTTARVVLEVDDTGPNDPGPGDPLVSDPAEDGTPDHPFDTIQEAIVASLDGGEIIVAPGLYPEAIDLLGKSLTLRSTAGSATTTIDATGLGASAITCQGDEGKAVRIEGFTVTGGSTVAGGGLVVDGGDLEIVECVFNGNEAVTGGAIAVSSGGVIAVGCTFNGNSATEGGAIFLSPGTSASLDDGQFFSNTAVSGGAIHTTEAGLELIGSTFHANEAALDGGATHNTDSLPIVTDCVFTENESGDHGGAIYDLNSHTLMSGCTLSGNMAVTGGGMHVDGQAMIMNSRFDGNHAGADGGGMFILGGLPTITTSAFIGNDAGGDGGGLATFVSATPTLVNCLFAQNLAIGAGGGVHHNLIVGIPTHVNCTFAANTAAQGGAMSSTVFLGSPIVHNSIIWANSAPQIDGDTPSATYNCVEGGLAGPGNLDVDPLFRSEDDFRLRPGSPVIDAGDNGVVPETTATDLDGEERFIDDPATADSGAGFAPLVDMGAYEFPALCPADITFDGVVNVLDLVELILDWGGGAGATDVNGDESVDVLDLVEIVLNWGACPG